MKIPPHESNHLLVVGYQQKIKEIVADELALIMKLKLSECSNGVELEKERKYLPNSIMKCVIHPLSIDSTFRE